MTTHSQHGNLGAWAGLAVGLALAWGGWHWFERWRTPSLTELSTSWSYLIFPVEARPWYGEPWAQPAVLGALVILVLLFAVAGAMIGRRSAAGTA